MLSLVNKKKSNSLLLKIDEKFICGLMRWGLFIDLLTKKWALYKRERAR